MTDGGAVADQGFLGHSFRSSLPESPSQGNPATACWAILAVPAGLFQLIFTEPKQVPKSGFGLPAVDTRCCFCPCFPRHCALSAALAGRSLELCALEPVCMPLFTILHSHLSGFEARSAYMHRNYKMLWLFLDSRDRQRYFAFCGPVLRAPSVSPEQGKGSSRFSRKTTS